MGQVNVFRMLAYLRLFDKTMNILAVTTKSSSRYLKEFRFGMEAGAKATTKATGWIIKKNEANKKAFQQVNAELTGKSGARYRVIPGKSPGKTRFSRYDASGRLKFASDYSAVGDLSRTMDSWGSVLSGGFGKAVPTMAEQLGKGIRSSLQATLSPRAIGMKVGALGEKMSLANNALKLRAATLMSIPPEKATRSQRLQQGGLQVANVFREIGGVGKEGFKLAALPFKALGKIGSATSKGMSKAFAAIGSIPGGGMALSIALDVLMQLLTALNPFKTLMSSLTTIFGIYGSILSQAFIPLIEKLFEVMLSDQVLDVITMISNALLQMVVATLPIIDVLMPIMMIFIQLIASIATAMAPLVETLMPVFKVLLIGIAYVLWLVANAIIILVNAILFQINLIIGFINMFLPSSKDIGYIPMAELIPAPQIAMADGGIVMGPTVALVGESGPEAVVPLDQYGIADEDMIYLLRSINEYLRNIEMKLDMQRSVF